MVEIGFLVDCLNVCLAEDDLSTLGLSGKQGLDTSRSQNMLVMAPEDGQTLNMGRFKHISTATLHQSIKTPKLKPTMREVNLHGEQNRFKSSFHTFAHLSFCSDVPGIDCNIL